MSSRFQRAPLRGSDVLRRTDNLNTLTTRELRIQYEDGSYPLTNSVPHMAGPNGLMQFSDATMTSEGSLMLPGALNVDGQTILRGAITTEGALVAEGTADFRGVTTFGAAVTAEDDVQIKGSLTTDGPTTLVGSTTVDGDLMVGGILTLGPAPTRNIERGLGDRLNVNGSAEITGGLHVGGTLTAATINVDALDAAMLDVAGAGSFGGTITADAVTIQKGLTVSGAGSIGGTLTVGELTTVGKLVTKDADITALNVSDSARVGGTLTADIINVDTLDTDVLTVAGAGSFGGAVTADALTIQKGLIVGGASSIKGTLTVEDTATVADLVADGSVSVASGAVRLTNGGIVVTGGNISAPGGTITAASVDLTGRIDVDGGLDVGDDTRINGELEVTGFTKIGAAGAEVTGPAKVVGRLTAAGGAAVTGDMSVTGNVEAETVSIGDTLGVGGALTADSVSVTQGLTVEGAIVANGGVTIDNAGDAAAVVKGDLKIEGRLETSAVELTGNVNINGAFSVQEAAVFKKEVQFDGVIKHSGQFEPALGSNITLKGINGIRTLKVEDKPGEWIIEATGVPNIPGDGYIDSLNGGKNISIGVDDDNEEIQEIYVDIDETLDMHGNDISGASGIELVPLPVNAQMPSITFKGLEGISNARVQYDQSDVAAPRLAITAPSVAIDATGSDGTIALSAGSNTVTVSSDKVIVPAETQVELGSVRMFTDATGNFVIDNTVEGKSICIEGIPVMTADEEGFDFVLGYNPGKGELRQVKVPKGSDISGGRNIEIKDNGVEQLIHLEITETVDVGEQRLTNVGGIDFPGGAAIDVAGTALTVASGGTARIVLDDTNGVEIKGILPQTTDKITKVLAYNEATCNVTYQDAHAGLTEGTNIDIDGTGKISVDVQSTLALNGQDIVGANQITAETLTLKGLGVSKVDSWPALVLDSNNNVVLQQWPDAASVTDIASGANIGVTRGANGEHIVSLKQNLSGITGLSLSSNSDLMTDSNNILIDGGNMRFINGGAGVIMNENGIRKTIPNPDPYYSNPMEVSAITLANGPSIGISAIGSGSNVVLQAEKVKVTTSSTPIFSDEQLDVDGRVKATGALLTNVPETTSNPYVLTVDGTTGEIQKQELDITSGISGGTNISTNGGVINLQISSDIDMQGRAIANVESVKGDAALTLGTASDSASLTMSDTGGVTLEATGLGSNIVMKKIQHADTISNPDITTTLTLSENGAAIQVDSTNDRTASLRLQTPDGKSGEFIKYTAGSKSIFKMSTSGDILLSANGGNVGILSAGQNPTEKLDVGGTIKASGLKFDTNLGTSTSNTEFLSIGSDGVVKKQTINTSGAVTSVKPGTSGNIVVSPAAGTGDVTVDLANNVTISGALGVNGNTTGIALEVKNNIAGGTALKCEMPGANLIVRKDSGDRTVVENTGGKELVLRSLGSSLGVGRILITKDEISSGKYLQIEQQTNGNNAIQTQGGGNLYLGSGSANTVGISSSGATVTGNFTINGGTQMNGYTSINTDREIAAIKNGDNYMYMQSPISSGIGRIRIGGWNTAMNSVIPLTLNEAGGNVGIGTSAPAAPLDVNGNTNITGEFIIKGSSSGAMRFLNVGGKSYIQAGADATFGSTADLNFTAFSSGYSRMTIAGATGYVGIGTGDIAPAYRLDVNGDTRVTGNLILSGNIVYSVQQI